MIGTKVKYQDSDVDCVQYNHNNFIINVYEAKSRLSVSKRHLDHKLPLQVESKAFGQQPITLKNILKSINRICQRIDIFGVWEWIDYSRLYR